MNNTESKPHRGMPKGRTGNPNGRPPLGDKKKKSLHVRIDPELFDWLTMYAETSGQNLSSAVQKALSIFRNNKEA